MTEKVKNAWRIARGNKSFFISILLCFLALIFLVWYINLRMPLNFDYSGNATYAKTELSAQSVPTVIDGIIASTSVIIAFGGAVVGLMYREIASRSEVGAAVIFVTLVLFVASTTYEFYAFFAFSTGGVGFLEYAFRNALTGFVVALFMLFLAFIMIVEIMSSIERRQRMTI